MKPKKTIAQEVAEELEVAAETKTEVKPDAVAETSNEVPAKVETPAASDYSKYAEMMETPTATERRKFDTLTLDGTVETEVVGDGVEKRKPATFYKSYQTRPKLPDGKTESEKLNGPITIVPIKYRQIMIQTTGTKGEILVLKSSEFNGKVSDKVVVFRYGPKDEQGKQKIVASYGPMTVTDARNTFKNAEGKGVLKDKVHVYALHNGELVCYSVKGTGLWEKEPSLKDGKTDASRTPHRYLKDYFSQFAMTEPYFLFEMKVDSVYRDHLPNKYYRPIFERGARINPEVEAVVLTTLEDLHKYFTEQDKATAEFVASAPTPTTPVAEGDVEDVAF
jgi:hypothetical protein